MAYDTLVTFRTDATLRERLDEAARGRPGGVSEFIRDAIDRHIAASAPAAQPVDFIDRLPVDDKAQVRALLSQDPASAIANLTRLADSYRLQRDLLGASQEDQEHCRRAEDSLRGVVAGLRHNQLMSLRGTKN